MADTILKELTLKVWRQKDAKSKGGFETYKGHDVSYYFHCVQCYGSFGTTHCQH